MTRVDRALLFVLPFILALLASPQARAQSPEAEVLFRDGRKLIKAGKLEAGCDKLEASEKLESSVGTLLNLGDCREKLGRFATAWAAFRKAESIAKLRGNDEKRRNEAARRATTLEAKLPNLVITVTSRVDGLVIKRDNDVVDPALWNIPMPVDPDSYTIVAEAPGFKPWRTEVNVTGKPRRKLVTVPVLERAPVAPVATKPPPPPQNLGPTTLPEAAPPPVVVSEPRLAMRSTSRPSTWTTARKVSLGIGLVGAAAAGTGVYFGLRSRDLEGRSNEICPTSTCDDPQGLELNADAQRAARNANILYGVGGVAVASAIVVWLVGGPDEQATVTPAIGRDSAGISFGGAF